MMTRILLGLLAVLFIARAEASETPEARYQAAQKELKSYCDQVCGIGIGDDPAEAKALDALHNATKDWTVGFLSTHPRVSDKALAAALAKQHTRYKDGIAPIGAARLGPDLYVFTTRWGETGNVFIVARRDGHWSAVWDIRNAPTNTFAALKAWRTDHSGCLSEEGHDGKFDCGPLWGKPIALKPDTLGRARFAVNATYAQGAGFTVTSQISFWRWNDTAAEPLLSENYHHEEDDVLRGRDTADAVVVRVKGEYESFEACGACEGRQFNWTFRVLRDRIEDGGMRRVHPEADFVDGVFARLYDRQPVADVAPPAVLALMAENQPSLGDLVTRTTRTGARICLFSDSMESFDLHLNVVRRRNGYFITKAWKVPAIWNKPHCVAKKGNMP